jgi:hypothetical protein
MPDRILNTEGAHHSILAGIEGKFDNLDWSGGDLPFATLCPTTFIALLVSPSRMAMKSTPLHDFYLWK